jgi:hypothetical protein
VAGALVRELGAGGGWQGKSDGRGRRFALAGFEPLKAEELGGENFRMAQRNEVAAIEDHKARVQG